VPLVLMGIANRFAAMVEMSCIPQEWGNPTLEASRWPKLDLNALLSARERSETCCIRKKEERKSHPAHALGMTQTTRMGKTLVSLGRYCVTWCVVDAWVES
jgi:hypothetical protein